MHDLLDRLAPEVDVDIAWEEVVDKLPGQRRRRAAVRGLAVAASVVALAGGITAVMHFDRDDPSTVRTAPTDEGVGTTTDPTRVHGVAVDVEVAPPGGWEVAGRLTIQPDDDYLLQVMAAGTFSLQPDLSASMCEDWPLRAAQAMGPTDALVWVAEVRDPDPNLDLTPERPVYEELPRNTDRTCPAAGRSARFDTFQDGGQAFVVRVLLGDRVSAATMGDAVEVLNSLRFPAKPETDGQVVAVTADGSLQAEHPPSWSASSQATFDDQVLVVGTNPLRPWCPAAARCRVPVCPTWPSDALAELGVDDAIVWFEAFSTATVHLPPRRDLASLPTSPSVERRCADGAAVTVANLAGPDGSGIEIHVALGPDASARVRAEALAIINSVAYVPR